MDRQDLVQQIIQAVQDFLMPDDTESVTVSEETRLLGANGVLDSLGLVSLVLDLEQQINDTLGTTIALADERAMSQTRSPFRSVSSLADYIETLLAEQQGG